MIGDILIFKDEHYLKANSIISKLCSKYNKNKFVLTIGSSSGTGKSEISIIIQKTIWENYNIRSKILHIDNYYLIPWQKRNRQRKKEGIKSVGKHEINWKKLECIIYDFKVNEPILFTQRIHKYLDTFEYSMIKNKNIDILIIEGLYANYLDADYKVYLEGSEKQTLEFRKERGKEVIDDFRLEVLKKERRDIIKTRKLSDTVIPWSV